VNSFFVLPPPQIEWNKLADNYDLVTIGYEKEKIEKYPIWAGHEKWKENLKKQFPAEEKAIDAYIDLHRKGLTETRTFKGY
jgi:all-trans-retinol 13,14-reductase